MSAGCSIAGSGRWASSPGESCWSFSTACRTVRVLEHRRAVLVFVNWLLGCGIVTNELLAIQSDGLGLPRLSRSPVRLVAGSVRTTISIPADLRRRMCKVKEDVNWSALACVAFEAKLLEIANQEAEEVYGKGDRAELNRATAAPRTVRGKRHHSWAGLPTHSTGGESCFAEGTS